MDYTARKIARQDLAGTRKPGGDPEEKNDNDEVLQLCNSHPASCLCVVALEVPLMQE